MVRKPRVLFILSNLLGHRVYSNKIYEAVKDLEGVDKEYLYINGEDYKKFSAPIILRKSDVFTIAWIARKKFEETFTDYSFDGFFFQTWDPILGLWKWSKGVDTAIVIDATPQRHDATDCKKTSYGEQMESKKQRCNFFKN